MNRIAAPPDADHGAGITVACVLRSGGAYGQEHVAGLARQVAHWMPGARFACLSDVPVPCERVPMQTTWPGWWAKVELFRHFRERTLYLDLDSVIVGDPVPLVTGRFTMIRNWVYPGLLASGVMSWQGDYGHIAGAFELVTERIMAEYVTRERWGDQAFIAEQAAAGGEEVDTFEANSVASFRYQRLRYAMGPPRRARVVAFNADCPPWNGPPWARRWWPGLQEAA